MVNVTLSRPPRCREPECPANNHRGRRLYVRAEDNKGYVPAGWLCRAGHAIRVDLPDNIMYRARPSEKPDEDANGRLGRLFKNADLFFWGAFDKKQSVVYQALATRYGLDFRRGTYGEVAEDLVESYGGLKLREIAAEELTRRLGDDQLKRLEGYWNDGRWPTTPDELGGRALSDFRGVLDIDTYLDKHTERLHEFARGWGALAPVLFEFGTATGS